MYSKNAISFLVLLFFVISMSLHAQTDYRVLSSSSGEVTIEYTPKVSDLGTTQIANQTYKLVKLFQGDISRLQAGQMQLPSRFFQVGVSDQKQCAVRVVSAEYSELQGVLPPVPKVKKEKEGTILISEPDNSYSMNQYFPTDIAVLASTGSMRGIPVAQVQVNPIQCNPVERKIRVIKKIVVSITFPVVPLASGVKDDELIKDAIINYPVAKQFTTQVAKKVKQIQSVNSVLANGKWVRFESPDEGIYKITGDMLSSMGFDISNLNPSSIKIYNNGGQTLPESVTAARPGDLQELAIYCSATGTKFTSSDYILFYGRGISYWDYNKASKQYVRNRNPYSNVNYYWITVDNTSGVGGKRIPSVASLSSSGATTVESTVAFSFLEDDKINIGKTGRDFFGDEFNQTVQSRTYLRSYEGILPTSSVTYKYRFINSSSASVLFTLSENGNQLLSKYVSGYYSDQYTIGVEDNGIVSAPAPHANTSATVQFYFNSGDASTHGYLDYFEASYLRDLKPLQDYLVFFSPLTDGVAQYHLSNFLNPDNYVFDVTDYANPKLIQPSSTPVGSDYYITAATSAAAANKYIAVNSSVFKTPKNFTTISNQNLRGESQGAQYIIITPKEFLDQAKRLADFRTNKSKVGMSSIVVKTDDIYNEFSGGIKDPTAYRDYLRNAFLNWATKPQYVLLFGHGDYDYRNIEGYNNNYVLPFETAGSLLEVYSYNWDDYYACIDNDDQIVDLALGRIPARTVDEAQSCVDKIISYETSVDRSLWRNLVTLVADDGWTTSGFTDGSTHTDQSEDLSGTFIPASFNQKKIYLSDYPTVISSFGRRKPDVNTAIIRAINEGTMLLNYIGHGSPELWAHEQVFVKDVTIPQLVNTNLFFLTAATCDFAYFDRPNDVSAAEELITKEGAGAIGAFSATRPVYSAPNAALNQAFYTAMLNPKRDTLNLTYPIGYAYFNTKAGHNAENDLKYHLLCDPALRLNVPQLGGNVDSINGLLTNVNIQIKALSHVSVNGKILKPNSKVLDPTFNGEGVLTLYDSDRLKPLPEFGSSYFMVVQGGPLFNGRVKVNNGVFSSDFTVPKDISYENNNGKLVLYFHNDKSDGLSYTNKVVIGGTDSSVPDDGKGPDIQIAFDDSARTDAYLVKPNSTLYVLLKDQTGINATGAGLGRIMHGVLDGNEANPIDFTNYYLSDENSGGKSGKVVYGLTNLSAGEHSLKVDAWDIFNNASSKTTYFKVNSSEDLVIDNVYNYPNPFSGSTVFMADHNDPQPVTVRIKVYSVAGRLLHKIERAGISERNIKIPWDGRDIDGNMLSNGVYLYRLTIVSQSGFGSKTFTGKLAIVR